MQSQEMTSRGPSQNLPAPQIFTIYSLPSYDDAVKSSGDPPSYDQALTDPTLDSIEAVYRPQTSRVSLSTAGRPRRNDPDNRCQKRYYRGFYWALAGLIIFLLGYVIYIGVFRSVARD